MAGGTDIERLRALVERVAESLVDSCTHDALGKDRAAAITAEAAGLDGSRRNGVG